MTRETDPVDDRYRQLLDTAPDAMVIANARGQIEFVNIQTEKVFGYSRSELIGQPIEILIPERFRKTHVGHRNRFVAEPTFRPMGSGLQLYGRRKDGCEIAIEVSLSPLATPDGTVVSAAIRDVTERHRLEVASKLASDRLHSAVEATQDAFALFDADDRLVLCNSVFRQTLPQSLSGSVVGRTFRELLDARLSDDGLGVSGETAEKFRQRRLAYRLDPRGAIEYRSADGRSWRITDCRTAEGGIVSTMWDLTDDVRREIELRQAQAAAESASAAKSEFLSSMSHELRTPLNAILGFAQLLQRDKKPALNERQLGMLEHVVKGGEHLLRLIDEVLDLSRIEAGGVALSIEPVKVTDVLSEVKTTLGPMASRAGIELRIVGIASDLPQVMADRTRFAQILMNYGSNSIKYGRPGSSVTLIATALGASVRVTVVDTGLGIAADKHDKIFQPFQRAGQETGPIEGTGIGLALSKRLAELMGGRVGFRSVAGEGSEFWVELPAHTARRSQPPARPAGFNQQSSPLTSGEGPAYKIIYVEDNPSNVAFMQALLGSFERVALLTAPTAEIGIELVRAHQPAVVIMDINLPGMSGFEALRQLREWPETRHIPVIALSAAAMPRDTKRGEQAGFVRYLTKPVKVDDLTSLLETLLAAVPEPAAE
jgi:PAS domain S-box-containing protein